MGLISAAYDVYVDHKRIIPPLWPLLPALFSKLPSRRRGTVHIQTAYPRFASRSRACIVSRTRDTPVPGSHVRSHLRRYTCDHNDTRQFRARRTLGSPRRPCVKEATLFVSSSSFSRPARPTFSFSIRERLVERAAPSNRISNRVESFVRKKRKKFTPPEKRRNVGYDRKLGSIT